MVGGVGWMDRPSRHSSSLGSASPGLEGSMEVQASDHLLMGVLCFAPSVNKPRATCTNTKLHREQSLRVLKHTEMEKDVFASVPEESLTVKQCPRKVVSLSDTRKHSGRSQALLGSWAGPEILLLWRLSKLRQME